MKIFHQNKGSDALCHASIQMNPAEMKALREFMHQEQAEIVMFPRNVSLNYRGSGWYRLNARSFADASQRVSFAVRLILRFMNEQKVKAIQDRKAAQMHRNGRPAQAYTGGQFVAPKTTPSHNKKRHHKADSPRPASSDALKALAQRFQR